MKNRIFIKILINSLALLSLQAAPAIKHSPYPPFKFPHSLQTRLPLLRVTQPFRTIVSELDLKHTYDSLTPDKSHLSPIHGMPFEKTDALCTFYELAQYMPTPTAKLALELFHVQENELRVTHNKSKPAYAFDPEIIADIIHYLDKRQLSNPAIRHMLIQKLKDSYTKLCGLKLSENKIAALLDLIEQSASECFGTFYPKHYTTVLLQAFLCHKADSRADILTYLDTLNNHHSDSLFKESYQENQAWKYDSYKPAELSSFWYNISQLTPAQQKEYLLDQHFEHSVCAFRSSDMASYVVPQVIQSSYGFRNKGPRSNCVEAAFHNFLNTLLYNPITKKFDFTLLPTHVTPHDCLRTFYENQHYEPYKVNDKGVGQAFMDMVSGHTFLTYHSEDYELLPTKDNFIKLMNHLFGAQASTTEELAKHLSDDANKVSIKSPFEHYGTITIVIQNIKAQKYSKASLLLQPAHGSYEIESQSTSTTKIILPETIETLWEQSEKNDHAYLLTLLLPHEAPSLHEGFSYTENFLFHISLAYGKDLSKKSSIIRRINFLLEKGAHPHTLIIAFLHALTKGLPTDDRFFFKQGHLKVLRTLSKKLKVNPKLDEVILSIAKGLSEDFKTSIIEELFLYQAPSISAGIKEYCNQYLLEHTINKTETIDESLSHIEKYWYEKNYSVDDILYFIELGALLINKQNTSIPLYLVTDLIPDNHKRVEMALKRLSTQGIDINKVNEDPSRPHNPPTTLLSKALEREIYQSIPVLINAGANVNIANDDSETPLLYAASKGLNTLVKILIEAGAEVNKTNKDGDTPLYWAAVNGHKDAIEVLLNAGADVNQVNRSSNTPLVMAAQDGREDIVKLLLKAGANVNQANVLGITPLSIAARKGHKNTIEILLNAGADVNKAPKDGMTPLWWAVHWCDKNKGILELLLKAGADVNRAPNDAETPLTLAISRGYEDIVKLLLNAGADMTQADNDGKTPLYLAKLGDYPAIIKLLKDASASS
jgi:ankyrin repeat protein